MDSLKAVTYEGSRFVKMEVDKSSSCDETILKYKGMSKNEIRFNEALEMLMQLEKQAGIVSIVDWILTRRY
jgi:26S proteasome regulatory subunit N5